MKVSYSTDPGNYNTSVGYGYAGYNIIRALQRIGHKVVLEDPTALVQLSFVQPEYYFFYENQYKIGYTPWESTELPDTWLPEINNLDEFWTTSPWCADVFRNNGVSVPIKVYEHGIEEFWTPQLREPDTRIRFLHIGEPASRKGGQTTVNAFRKAFGNRSDVSLTIKAHDVNTTRLYDHYGSILGPITSAPNIKLITEEVSQEELLSLYHMHDVLVYPSWGEGFGFIPLQGLATGMPVICTAAWAAYSDYLLDLGIDSRPANSRWPKEHPGKMCEPSTDHLVTLMRTVADNYTHYANMFYAQAPAVHETYDWDRLTEAAFRPLVKRFSQLSIP